MKIYRIEGPGAVRFGGSQTDARAKRDELVTKLSCKKKDVVIYQDEVAAGKAGVLAFLNKLCEQLEEVR